MTVAGKLQIKSGHVVSVLHAPADVSFDLPEGASTAADPDGADAVVLFATNRAELDARGEPVVAAARRDALAWVAYPKAKQLGTDLNRDTLRDVLVEKGIQPVRQVAHR